MAKLIAIIDDEVEMEFIYMLMLEEIIETNQVKMKFFSDTRYFESWLQYSLPDLILTDISMPHLTGLELGHRIREMGRIIPTYFVSGHEETEYAESIEKFGMCRYIAKPINTIHFLEFIKTDLGLKG